jgi:ATP-dependent Clp endopeptidase proteolytic subunit ClpP
MAEKLCAPCLFAGMVTPSVTTVKGYQTCQNCLSYDTKFFRDWESAQDPKEQPKDPAKNTARTRVMALRAARTDWYQIKAQADGPTLVSVYDEIGWGAITAKEFVRDLADLSGDLEVHLNSPGGDVFDGIAIYQALSQRDGTVRVVVDGLAASIASVIAMAASPGQLAMARNATMMIHDGWAMCVGNAAEMARTAKILDDASANIASIYAERTGRSVDQWRAAMREETWYGAQEAVDAGLADSVLPKRERAAKNAGFDLSVFAHAPAGLQAAMGRPRAANQTADPDPGAVVAELLHLVMHVRPGGSDASKWNAGAAMKAAAKAEDPGAALKAICAGRRVGDPALRKSWALAHHKHPGDAPNQDGVRAALSQLPQTGGLTNEAAARAHLEAHLAAIQAATPAAHDHPPLQLDPADFRAAMTIKEAAK